MGQIAKTKKKGRPSKADLASAAAEREVRRSGRRRNVRYTFDFDDYLDDDEYFFVEEEADERRREKKIKLLLKLHSGGATRDSPYLRRKGMQLLDSDDYDDDGGGDGDDDGCKKKRRLVNGVIDGGNCRKKEKLIDGGTDDDGYGENCKRKRKLINGVIDGENCKKKWKLINREIDDDGDEGLKKRKVINDGVGDEGNGIDTEKEEEEEENSGGDDDCGLINEDDEVKGEKREDVTSEVDYALGTPTKPLLECPLPDKKILELILNKLQKKDIYGVYAEPVDPEELPDYHDLIENPMDFSTIRRKLSNGSYATLEQFESDVFLLCCNAMQYNEPDTIYYKQARSIQDLAKRKFQKLRIDNERLENQVKSEPKTKPVSVLKKQIRRQITRPLQEPIGSDFLTGATPAIGAHTKSGSNEMQTGVAEKASNLDLHDEGNHFVIDTSVDKLRESLAGRGPNHEFGRNALILDENCAGATNSTGGQPNASCPSSDSAFSPFDRETKQLIPVGLYIEHAYARSLARFAGSLGHVAWRVASKRIEQILPPGTKFGRGWVGEYEPLPTPVQIPDYCNTETDFFAKPRHIDNPNKQKMLTNPVASGDSCIFGPPLEGKLPFPNHALSEVTTSSIGNSFRDEPSVRESSLKGKSSFPCSNGIIISGSSTSRLMHPSTSQINSLLESSKKVVKPVELVDLFSGNKDSSQLATERCFFNKVEAPTPKSAEMVSINRSPLPSASSFKQSNVSEVAFGSLPTDKPLLNGRAINCTGVGSKERPLCSEMNKLGPYISNGQEQALCDPAQLMKMLSENNKYQQNLANQSAFGYPSVPSVAQSLNREDSSHAAAGVEGSWKSIGSGGLRPTVGNVGLQRNQVPADSLYNATFAQQSQFSRFRGGFPAPVYLQPGKTTYPFHGVSSQPVRVGSAVQYQNQPVVVPQLSPADLSRLQVQSPWRNVSPHTQQAHKQGTCPPDLNVSFHSTGSPGRPSPGVVVESRPPDLALQL